MIGNLTIDDVVKPDGSTSMGSLGGNSIHTATAARIWGVPVGVVTRVGDDFPAGALDMLRQAGVDTLGVHEIPGPTMRFWILYEKDGSRSWVKRTPAERSVEVAPEPSDVPTGWLEHTRPLVVHVAAMPLPAAALMVDHIHSMSPSATVTLDVYDDCCSDREALLAVARRVDDFVPISHGVGGALVANSDAFYTSPSLLIRPDEPRTMGDGCETRRRRDTGNDFAVFKLGIEGEIRQVVVDTTYFRYNATPEIALWGCSQPPAPVAGSSSWEPLLGRTRLQPDTSHVFSVSPRASTACVRLDAFPDGGVSRLRLIGRVDRAARRGAGYRWFNSLPADQATRCLADASIGGNLADRVLEQRPLPEDWLDQARSGTSGTAESLRALAAMLEGPAG